MKKNILVLVLFLSSFFAFSTDTIPVLITQKAYSDSVSYRISLFYNSNPVSIMFNNMAFCDYQGKYICLHINQNNDSMYIYNATDDIDTRIKLPFKISMPVQGLYFHNYDSIFIFLDRTFVAKMRGYGNEIDDFVMIDSEANVHGRYLLNNVPHIYNGQLDPMIFYNRTSFSGQMISGNILYIPFAIYKPIISDSSLKDLDLKLLCAYNLETNELKMMNVKIPEEDIGKIFNSKSRSNSFDYFIYNDSTMYISYLYSSDIYRLNLKTDKLERIAEFDGFSFNNIPFNSDAEYATWFYAPKYSASQKLFVRKIIVNEYRNCKTFTMAQILDKDMKLIGYSFEDSLWSAIRINSMGELILCNKEEHYVSYKVTGFEVQQMSVDDIYNRILVKKKETPHTRTISINKDLVGFEDRMILYLNDLGIEQPVKIVLISTDIICGHCIEYLMNEMKNNKEEFIKQKIFYVFYGSDVMGLVGIINKYNVEKQFYYMDPENKNSAYFSREEMKGYPLVIYQKNRIEVVQSEVSNLIKDFEKFRKKKLKK